MISCLDNNVKCIFSYCCYYIQFENVSERQSWTSAQAYRFNNSDVNFVQTTLLR